MFICMFFLKTSDVDIGFINYFFYCSKCLHEVKFIVQMNTIIFLVCMVYLCNFLNLCNENYVYIAVGSTTPYCMK